MVESGKREMERKADRFNAEVDPERFHLPFSILLFLPFFFHVIHFYAVSFELRDDLPEILIA